MVVFLKVHSKLENTNFIRQTVNIRQAQRNNISEESKSMQFILPLIWKTTIGGKIVYN